MDPADRVAAARAHSDDIKTWAVSEVDKKGKKKKGTLGVGNGSVFFASEADKVRNLLKQRGWLQYILITLMIYRPRYRSGKVQTYKMHGWRNPSTYTSILVVQSL